MFLSNPSFVLAIVATSSFFGLPSVKAEKIYAGYSSSTDADSVADKDIKQEEFETILSGALTTCDGLADGLTYYGDVGGPSSFLKDLPTYTTTDSRTWELYEGYYGDREYFDTWVTAALKGLRIDVGLAKPDFSNIGGDDECKGRQEAAKKGTAYISGFLEVAQYLQEAEQEVAGGCVEQSLTPCTTAITAWNNAAAYYVGSLEGVLGLAIQECGTGKQLYALGNKRCANYKTCGVNADSESKCLGSKVNFVLVQLLSKGAAAVRQGDLATVQKTIKEINSQLIVGPIQGALRYGYRLGEYNTGDFVSTKAFAEGATFAAAAIPHVWGCDTKAARVIQAQYKIKKNSRAVKGSFNFKLVKNAFECNYEALGISCDDIGSLYDGDAAPRFNACKSLDTCEKKTTKYKKKCNKYNQNPNPAFTCYARAV